MILKRELWLKYILGTYRFLYTHRFLKMITIKSFLFLKNKKMLTD